MNIKRQVPFVIHRSSLLDHHKKSRIQNFLTPDEGFLFSRKCFLDNVKNEAGIVVV